MAASAIGYLLSGIEPRDAAWSAIGKAGRAEFWRRAADVGIAAKDRSLKLGLDKNGRKMAPLSPKTIAARAADINPVTGRGPYSPQGRAIPTEAPLQASGGLSRTVVLLRYELRPSGVWYYWGRDPHTGLDWGVVLQRHAQGFAQHFRWPPPGGWGYVPSRDVIGLSKQDVAIVRATMTKWWQANKVRLIEAAKQRRPLYHSGYRSSFGRSPALFGGPGGPPGPGMAIPAPVRPRKPSGRAVALAPARKAEPTIVQRVGRAFGRALTFLRGLIR